MNIRKPLLLGLAVTAALAACRQPAAPDSHRAECLDWSAGMVTLEGMAEVRTVTAPDKDYRRALVLTLDAPVCVNPRPGRAGEFPALEDVRQVELVPRSDFADAFSLAGQRVSAQGSLSPLSGDGAAEPLGLVLQTLKPAQ
ncbi:hypothetical protein [Luteimonas sp. e5]